MKISEVYSGFLSSEDLPEGQEIKLTIESVRLPNNADKGLDGKVLDNPIIKFEKVKKEAVLNRTNAKAIRRMHGNETDDWIGKDIVVFSTVVKAFGKKVHAWRVKEELAEL